VKARADAHETELRHLRVHRHVRRRRHGVKSELAHARAVILGLPVLADVADAHVRIACRPMRRHRGRRTRAW
jgi:hypothetical protein